MNSLLRHEIPKRHLNCVQDGVKFIPGSEIYSLLYEDDSEKLQRKDFCSSCWNEKLNQDVKFKKRVHWKFQLEKKDIPTPSNRSQQALVLLKELRHTTQEKEKLFILCLYLARLKVLALRKELRNDEGLFYLYEILNEEDYLTVQVFDLHAQQIALIQQSIASCLKI